MFTVCKYNKGRIVPVYISNSFRFVADRFNLILVKEGFLTLVSDKTRIIINGPSLISLTGKEVLSLGIVKGSITSLSFAPDLVNVHLNYELILSDMYSEIAQEHMFPSFDIFFKHTKLYGGVLPLEDISLRRLEELFDRISLQINEQPTHKWSCKVRSELFLVFDMADYILNLYENGSTEISDMLEAIHAKIDTNISLTGLLREYNTNATTVGRRFKKHFGVTPIKFVQDLRLQLCSYVLAFTDITVNDIADSYEFNDSTYFAKLFKRKYKMSPYDFRNRKRLLRDAKLT